MDAEPAAAEPTYRLQFAPPIPPEQWVTEVAVDPVPGALRDTDSEYLGSAASYYGFYPR